MHGSLDPYQPCVYLYMPVSFVGDHVRGLLMVEGLSICPVSGLHIPLDTTIDRRCCKSLNALDGTLASCTARDFAHEVPSHTQTRTVQAFRSQAVGAHSAGKGRSLQFNRYSGYMYGEAYEARKGARRRPVSPRLPRLPVQGLRLSRGPRRREWLARKPAKKSSRDNSRCRGEREQR